MTTLSERIAIKVQGKKACAPHTNRALVLALRNDIRQALGDGWSVLAVYQTLHDEGRLSCSYQAFRRHVNRILLGKVETKKSRSPKSKNVAPRPPLQPVTSFEFNATPREEDLL